MDVDAVRLAKRDERGTRIRHGGKARFRDQTDIVSVVEKGEIRLDGGLVGVLVELIEFESVYLSAKARPGKETARRPDLFDDKSPGLRKGVQQGFGQHVFDGAVAQRGGDEV